MERISCSDSQHESTKDNHTMRTMWPSSLRSIVGSDPKAPRPLPRISSPQNLTREKCKMFLKYFVVYVQLDAENNGLDRPVSMNEFMEALVKHPDFVESTLWFPGLMKAVDSAPTKWHEYPALHYLDLSPSAETEVIPSRRSSSLSPTAKLFIPDRGDLPKRRKSSLSATAELFVPGALEKMGKEPLGVATQKLSGYTELVAAQYGALTMTRQVEHASSFVPHAQGASASSPSIYHQLVASENRPSIAPHQLNPVSEVALRRPGFGTLNTSVIVAQHPHPKPTRGASFQPGRKFEPSRVRQGLDRQITNEMKQLADRLGYKINPQYKGDVNKFTLRNATCPDHLNVAVRIDGIDPNATVQQIMSKFREGKVFSFHRSEPEYPRFPTAAADVTFMTVQAANAFIARSIYPGIWIGRTQVRVIPNKHKCRTFEGGDMSVSRVLYMVGPAGSMSAAGMVSWFKKGFFFDPVDQQEGWNADGTMWVMIAFQSIYGQSRQAKTMFEVWVESLDVEDQGKFQIFYGPDPCDQSSQYSHTGWAPSY